MKHSPRRIFAIAVAFTLVAVTSTGIATAAEWQPRAGCSMTLQWGDTAWAISQETGTPVADLAVVNPHVTDPAELKAGSVIDICPATQIGNAASVSLTAAPSAAQLRLNNWADAVQATAPGWATPADVRFLTAVSGPESGHGSDLWNPRDASANGKWVGSYGYIQIRVLKHPDRYPTDQYRDLDWLKVSLDHQATAAWIVLGDQDRTAWGPVKDGKLPSESCAGSSDVDRCLNWWAMADVALAN